MASIPESERAVPRRCLVTGGCGFVGHRLVEMLLQQPNIEHVVAFDIRGPTDQQRQQSAAVLAAKNNNSNSNSKTTTVTYLAGDISKKDAVLAACDRSVHAIDTVFHTAALVGPYHSYDTYLGVNYHGCQHIVEGCRANGIGRLVLCSTPSTRFRGTDITGQSEAELPEPPPGEFLQIYAETKAMGQHAVLDACDEQLLTVAVAPHQVYGPGDTLFIPAMLETSSTGALRIIGDGENIVSFCHVDNICHAMMLAATLLVSRSPVLGQFYVVTDGEDQVFWKVLDDLLVHCGYDSLYNKWKAPGWLTMAAAYVVKAVGMITGEKYKLDPFAVQMLIIHRYFSIEKVKREMGYRPLVSFADGWKATMEHFKQHNPYPVPNRN